jgi:hypothetical protein
MRALRSAPPRSVLLRSPHRLSRIWFEDQCKHPILQQAHWFPAVCPHGNRRQQIAVNHVATLDQ